MARVAVNLRLVWLLLLFSQVQTRDASAPMKVIIDFDPAGLFATGLDVDDDLAFLSLLGLESPELVVMGITAVAGNGPLRHTFPNAKDLLTLVNRTDLPVFPGISWHDQLLPWSLQRAMNTVAPDLESSDAAARYIVNLTMSLPPKSLTMLTLGPLSNVARALELEPRIAERLVRIVIMGGELSGTTGLDLNFAMDRPAANAVMRSEIPKTIVPIQLCAQSAVTAPVLSELALRCGCDTAQPAAVCTHSSKMWAQTHLMPRFVNPMVTSKFVGQQWEGRGSAGLGSGFVPWDVVAVLVLAQPEKFHGWHRLAVNMGACSAGRCASQMSTRILSAEELMHTHSDVVSVPFYLNESYVLSSMTDLMCSLKLAPEGRAIQIQLDTFRLVVLPILVPTLCILGVSFLGRFLLRSAR